MMFLHECLLCSKVGLWNVRYGVDIERWRRLCNENLILNALGAIIVIIGDQPPFFFTTCLIILMISIITIVVIVVLLNHVIEDQAEVALRVVIAVVVVPLLSQDSASLRLHQLLLVLYDLAASVICRRPANFCCVIISITFLVVDGLLQRLHTIFNTLVLLINQIGVVGLDDLKFFFFLFFVYILLH